LRLVSCKKKNSRHTNPLGRYSRFEEEETVETGCKARFATVVSMEWKVEQEGMAGLLVQEGMAPSAEINSFTCARVGE